MGTEPRLGGKTDSHSMATPWPGHLEGAQGCPGGAPCFFTAGTRPAQTTAVPLVPRVRARNRRRRRLSAGPVSPRLVSLKASNACQKYLCGRWKVNFSFLFFNGGGGWGGVVGEKGGQGGCASPASEWAGKGKLSKRSPCCWISALYELEDIIIIIILSSVTILQLLKGIHCGQEGASLGGGKVKQRLLGGVSWTLVPNSSTLFSLVWY